MPSTLGRIRATSTLAVAAVLVTAGLGGHAGPKDYARGDMWGCVGTWYAGDWRSERALGYISRVRTELGNRTWLQPRWKSVRPECSDVYGCPRGS